jgi:hypothetical protein
MVRPSVASLNSLAEVLRQAQPLYSGGYIIANKQYASGNLQTTAPVMRLSSLPNCNEALLIRGLVAIATQRVLESGVSISSQTS